MFQQVQDLSGFLVLQKKCQTKLCPAEVSVQSVAIPGVTDAVFKSGSYKVVNCALTRL